MFPNELFFGITLYDIFFAGGILGALIFLRYLSDKIGFSAKYFNFCLTCAVFAVIGGYASSVLFQAYYNFKSSGVFEITKNTGMTFYGGLIGGALTFLLIYFAVGHFVFASDKTHIKSFPVFECIASVCITFAHATGRLGCLSAGCCHGIATDSVFGVYMEYAGEKVLPVQLYESLFLYALFAFLLIRVLKNKMYGLQIYMVVYGIWRFFIEYLRGDDRGNTFISFLTPSQLTALLLIIGGVALYFAEKKFYGKIPDNEEN